MKVKAHLMVDKGYGLAISASQWRSELEQSCEDYNREMFSSHDEYGNADSTYLNHEKKRAVITVEFEVPDSIFKRNPVLKSEATVICPTCGKSDCPGAQRSDDCPTWESRTDGEAEYVARKEDVQDV